MENEFEQFQKVPQLTLEPFKEEAVSPRAAEPEAPVFDESILSEDERKMVDAFAAQIALTYSGAILQYGAGTQK